MCVLGKCVLGWEAPPWPEILLLNIVTSQSLKERQGTSQQVRWADNGVTQGKVRILGNLLREVVLGPWSPFQVQGLAPSLTCGLCT